MNNGVKKPILLCILDGWGIGDKTAPDNAIEKAHLKNYTKILTDFPHSKLGTSGLDVGLPEGQMGNSEVGHICIGSGRVIFQDLPRINLSIKNNELEKSEKLQNLIDASKNNKNTCHLLGLLSDGGVHSHQDHIVALAKILAQQGVNIKLHCFLDGRDVAQKSAKIYIEKLLDEIKNYPQIKIASISGRYYAMDRDKKWDRIELAYNAMALGNSPKFEDPLKAIDENYEQNVTDEFIKPICTVDYDGMKDGDSLIVANFRSDRARQISSALLEDNFSGFDRVKINFCKAAAMTKYSDSLSKLFLVLFEEIKIENSLGEIFANRGLKQLRIAETEKYAHVTFFFSGGREENFNGEDRILVQSPAVATYDLKPEMSSEEIGKKLSEAIKSDKYDFIVVNYANPDMVGHSGVLSASIKACLAIDEQLGMLRDLILEKNGMMIISADHGNIEDLLDENNKPHTAHTTNPVPFILIGNNLGNLKLKDGTLRDIAPTILSLMKIEKPTDMTGGSLIL